MGTSDSNLTNPTRRPARDYRVLPADELEAGMLARECGLGETAAQVLLHRGIRSSEQAGPFLDATLRGLSSPATMLDRAVAAERIGAAIRAGQRILVFGDYDVDGTTSALILTEIIVALGGNAEALIADRFRGGYGLSDPALERCLERDPALIVTCDCGSSDHERIRRANDRGIDVVVVDHHLVPEEPLPALAFLNPHRPECRFEYKGLCSAGLAFSLGAAVRAQLGASLDIRKWLDLVAVGTIADLAPLTGDNRRLVRAGLAQLGSAHARPAFQALRQLTKLPQTARITARDVAFRIAPRLNAPGRLGDADLTLRFLAATSATEAWGLAQEVEARNNERKALANQATEEAQRQALDAYGEAPASGIVAASDAWHRGVVGIVAARLVDRFNVPAAAIAFDGEEGHGSVRSTGGFDVHGALERSADTLASYGGHHAAAGLSLQRSALESFRDAFARETSDIESTETALVVDVELGGIYRVPTLEDLLRLGPFGEGYPPPRFLVNASVIEASSVGADGAHAKLRLRVGEASVRAFAPGLFAQIDGCDNLRVVGEFQPDHWVGGNAVELLVTDVLD